MKRILKLKDLPTPAFVINRHAFRQNCEKVLQSAKTRKIQVRPHIKTHKTVEGALLQASGVGASMDTETVTGFVASTLPEIRMLVQAAAEAKTTPSKSPFMDILYGVPMSAQKLPALDQLRQDLPTGGVIHLLMDHPVHVDQVEEYLKSVQQKTMALDASATKPFSVFMKLDTGYHRAGVPADSEAAVYLALSIIKSPWLHLTGVYSHCGHAYDVNDDVQLEKITATDMQQIQAFLERLQKSSSTIDTKDLIVSVGSTPSAFHHANTLGLPHLEVHPGNYTLYDRQQEWTGVCTSQDDIAGRVLARVIGLYEDRNTNLLDAGATALTKEDTPQGGMCTIAGHPDLECYKMSQEVIVAKTKGGTASLLPIGTMVNLLPNHSCLAAACFDKYYIIDDPTCSYSPNEPIVDEWIPAKGFA